MREDTDNPLYLLGDHLAPRGALRGSASLVVNTSSAQVARRSYLPFGEEWAASGTLPTDFGFTGQREAGEIGLHYYVARWYDSEIAHFTQADTIVPGAGNPAAWDRYGYVYCNPIRYVDPDGRDPLSVILLLIGGFLFFSQIPSDVPQVGAGETCEPGECGDPFVMAVGFGMMTAPAFTSTVLCGDGDCTNEGQMVSAAMDRVSATASNGLEDDLQIAAQTGQMSQELIQNLTTVSTQNANSSEVVIGLYNNGAGYTQMGAQQGLTYLNMPSNLYNLFLSNPSNLDFWKVNQLFLENAINAGKSFVLSTPYFEIMTNSTIEGTGIWNEVQYLLQNGYVYLVENGIEKLVPLP